MKITIDAGVYLVLNQDTDSPTFYVKAKLTEIDTYISGITLKSSKFNDELWVQMPYYKSGGTFKHYVEFGSKDGDFKLQLEQAARKAVDEYVARQEIEADFDKPIDFSAVTIPGGLG